MSQILVTYMDPRIRYAQPRWIARVPRMRNTIEVEASDAVEARFRASRKLGCSVAIVVVQRAYDPKLDRFGARA